jgi:hypothetical protein
VLAVSAYPAESDQQQQSVGNVQFEADLNESDNENGDLEGAESRYGWNYGRGV